MNLEHIQKWNTAGKRIADSFADQLNDKANNCDYSKYFYALYLFDGDNGTGPVPLPVLKYCIRQLTRRKGNVSNLKLKEILGQFLSISSLMFDSERTRDEALQLLKENKLQPTAIDVLGEKAGAHFDADRYEEKLSKRFDQTSIDTSGMQRLNWKVAALGEWFGENVDNVGIYTGGAAVALVILAGVIGVINAFWTKGFWNGAITTVLTCIVGYLASVVSFWIFTILARIFCRILRGIFYNIYTLLITVISFLTWTIMSLI